VPHLSCLHHYPCLSPVAQRQDSEQGPNSGSSMRGGIRSKRNGPGRWTVPSTASQYKVLPPLRCIGWLGCSAEKQIRWTCVFRVESLHVLPSALQRTYLYIDASYCTFHGCHREHHWLSKVSTRLKTASRGRSRSNWHVCVDLRKLRWPPRLPEVSLLRDIMTSSQ
jgi:hypothetical protein